MKRRERKERHPDFDIHFPAQREHELLQAMLSRASAPWKHQEHDPFGRPAHSGYLFFHRDGHEGVSPATLCIK